MLRTLIITCMIFLALKTYSQNKDFHINTIVIDPGHGGHDPGTQGAIHNEKDIALDIALRLGKHIHENNPNVKIVFTRTKDIAVPLFQRIKTANTIKADLFISIHCNASENPAITGSETFVMGLHRAEENLEVAQRENSVILLENDYEENYEGFDPESPVGHIVLTSFQDAYLGQSLEIADRVEQEFISKGYAISRGVKQAGFAVLRRATMPSVLIETGFLSNKKEEQYLASEEGQLKISHSIYRAISPYLNNKISVTTLIKKPVPEYDVINTSKTKSMKLYSVQFAAMSSKIDLSNKNSLHMIGEVGVVEQNGYYKYQIINIDTQDEAEEVKEKLATIGYKGAFIVSSD